MKNKWLAICFILWMPFTATLFANKGYDYPTYFSYSRDEIRELRGLSSGFEMSKVDLKKWDDVAADEIKAANLPYLKGVRIYTYLYVAQREAANLSQRINGCFMGSLDPISYAVLSLFLVNGNGMGVKSFQSDPYSKRLSEIVFAKIKDRVKKEGRLPFEFDVPDEYKRHEETFYSVGTYVAKWIPWYTKPETAYWALPPPREEDPKWHEEVEEIKKEQEPLTSEKKEAIMFWAGELEEGSGDWRVIANSYMFSHNVPFAKMIQVRAILMMSIFDGSIVCFGGKYYYSRVRPKVYDPSVQYVIPPPNHPSYPSGHSTESTIAASILSYYFPKHAENWERLAEEARMSRIWAGIHYPVDDQAGVESGKKVAKKILEEEKHKETQDSEEASNSY